VPRLVVRYPRYRYVGFAGQVAHNTRPRPRSAAQGAASRGGLALLAAPSVLHWVWRRREMKPVEEEECLFNDIMESFSGVVFCIQ